MLQQPQEEEKEEEEKEKEERKALEDENGTKAQSNST